MARPCTSSLPVSSGSEPGLVSRFLQNCSLCHEFNCVLLHAVLLCHLFISLVNQSAGPRAYLIVSASFLRQPSLSVVVPYRPRGDVLGGLPLGSVFDGEHKMTEGNKLTCLKGSPTSVVSIY